MKRITDSRVCPHRGERERVQDMLQSPFYLNRRNISLPSAPTWRRRFSVRAACVMLPKFSIIFNHGVDPQLRIIEHLGSMTQAARTENLRLPVGADGGEICLRFTSKGYCNRSCTRSHVPLRGHTRESVIRFIRGYREEMNKNKRHFDGVGEQGSHGIHWDRGVLHGHRNSETQNGAIFGGGRGGGRHVNNGGGGGVQRGYGSNTNPPPTKTDRKLGAAERTVAK